LLRRTLLKLLLTRPKHHSCCNVRQGARARASNDPPSSFSMVTTSEKMIGDAFPCAITRCVALSAAAELSHMPPPLSPPVVVCSQSTCLAFLQVSGALCMANGMPTTASQSPRWTLPAGPLQVLVPPAALSSSCVVLSRSAQAKANVHGGRLARVPVPVGPALAAAGVFSALRCWAIRVKRF
jgi:hypothetical protein